MEVVGKFLFVILLTLKEVPGHQLWENLCCTLLLMLIHTRHSVLGYGFCGLTVIAANRGVEFVLITVLVFD